MFDMIKAAKNTPKEVPIPSADVLAFVKALSEAYAENQKTEREIARIQAAKEILITNITKKYALYHDLFDKLFAERRAVMNKHFEIIDKGISSNNRELLLSGLQGLNHLVATSPFSDLANLSKMIENDLPIEL